MEQKRFPFQVKEADALTEGVVEGFAAVLGNVDDGDDVIDSGAFTKTIAENRARIKMGWQHSAPFGVTTDIREVAKGDLPPEVLARAPGATGGLYVRGQADMTAEDADRLKRLRSGSVDELSIGFQAVKVAWEKAGPRPIRHLKEVKLYEWSPVWVAMNPAALITGVKAGETDPADDPLDRLIAALRAVKAGDVLSAASRDLLEVALAEAGGLVQNVKAHLDAAEPTGDEPGHARSPVRHSALLDVRLRVAEADYAGLAARLRAVGL